MSKDTLSDGRLILMVAPQPFFRARGTPFSILHRIRALVESGYRVDLVTYPFGEDIELAGLNIIRCGKPPIISDVQIGPSVAKIFLDISLYMTTVRQLKEKRYDVIHSHEEAAFFVARLARRFGLLHIYDMHSSLPQQLENFARYNILPLRFIFSRLEQSVLRTSDAVITICPELEERVQYLCPNKPHRMIENTGDDLKIFAPSIQNIREELALGDDYVVLYTGTFEPYQGLKLLLDGFVQVASERSNVHLILVGGRPEQVDDMRDRVDDLGLTRRVSLVGTVHPAQIPEYLKAADLIVSPRSTGTNTPLKIYNYMRSGVPLVATDRPTHTQTLTSELCHLVPTSADGIAKGILRVMNDPIYARRIGDAARAAANKQFSDEQYVQKVRDFYQLALSS